MAGKSSKLTWSIALPLMLVTQYYWHSTPGQLLKPLLRRLRLKFCAKWPRRS